MWFNKNKNTPQKSIDEMRFVVLDTETTGFSFYKDRILCIGALYIENNVIAVRNTFEVYVNQNIYNKETAKIHGILKNSKKKLLEEKEALLQFLDYLGDSVIIAHHAIFDIQMLNHALKRQGLPELKNEYIDTSHVYKKTLLKSNLLLKKEQYSLDELAEKFSISKEDRHTALGDAYITAIAFLKIVALLKQKKEVTLRLLLK